MIRQLSASCRNRGGTDFAAVSVAGGIADLRVVSVPCLLLFYRSPPDRNSRDGVTLAVSAMEVGEGSHSNPRWGLRGLSFCSPRCGGRHRLPYPLCTSLSQPFHRLLETTDLTLQREHPHPSIRGVRVSLTVIRSHVLIGSFGSHGFIHPHVVIANTTVADMEAAEIGHCRGGRRWLLYAVGAQRLTLSPSVRPTSTASRVRPSCYWRRWRSSISLIISAPRSTVMKPTFVRDSSTKVSSNRR
jgi:hypothetical protein